MMGHLHLWMFFRIVVILGRMESGGLGFVAVGGVDIDSLNGGSGAWFLNS